MSFTVLEAGLYSLVVDGGRPRSRHLGVALGGAADQAAFRLGNALVGNNDPLAALELTLRGPTLRAESDILATVYGVPFTVTVNDTAIPCGKTFALKAGDILRIGGCDRGARGYLCVAGGFNTPFILGSQSMGEPLQVAKVLPCQPVPPAKMSMLRSRAMPFINLSDIEEHGQALSPCEAAQPTNKRGVVIEVASGCGATGSKILRVLIGPQQEWFTDDTIWNSEFVVSPSSNRMGLRLDGPALHRQGGELVSEAVVPGSVQVANDGRPIILGVDGQTIGGYPKVANVIRADLDRLAQLRPGDRVKFLQVSVDEAEYAGRQRQQQLRCWLQRLHLVATMTQ